VSALSSYASICGDIFISWGPRFSPYGDTVNLSRCFYSPAILTLCVNPQRRKKKKAAVEDIVVIKENAQRNVEGALPSDRRDCVELLEGGSNRREAIDVSAEYIALEYEAGELALTNAFDQARHLQLFNVRREVAALTL